MCHRNEEMNCDWLTHTFVVYSIEQPGAECNIVPFTSLIRIEYMSVTKMCAK